MAIMNIIKDKNTIYDFLLDAYDKEDYKRGYYLVKLMVKSKVNLDHFVKFLSKNRTTEIYRYGCYHQFYRNCFAKFIRLSRIHK